MKNKKYFVFIIIVFLSFGLVSKKAFAWDCPLQTVGLSRTNQQGKFNEVVALQTILSLYPNIYSDVEIVGAFGPKTEASIKRLQTDNGLPANGVITQDTLNLLCQQYYYCPFRSMVGRGDDLNPEQIIEIKILQSFLKFLPEVRYTGPVTGFFGVLTEQAITKFQNAYNHYPTKIMDFETINSLCNILKNINDINLTKAVTASPRPAAPATRGPLIAVCVADPKEAQPNQKVNFLSQTIGGNPPYRYQWSGYASGTSNSSSNVFTGNGAYTAILKVTDSSNQTTETSCQAIVGSRGYQPPASIPPITMPTTTTTTTRATQPPTDYTGKVSIQMTSDFHEIKQANDTINIFWTSNNAETCYATSAPTHQSWNGPVNLTGQKTISNLNIAPGNAIIFTLVCNNRNQTEVKYVVIERK